MALTLFDQIGNQPSHHRRYRPGHGAVAGAAAGTRAATVAGFVILANTEVIAALAMAGPNRT